MSSYWTTPAARNAWLVGIVVVAMTVCTVRLEVLLNHWNKDFFNALQAQDQSRFWSLLPIFGMLAGLLVANSAAAKYLSGWLELDWRSWLTRNFEKAWLARGTFYRLNTQSPHTDNPDQRLAEDTKAFASMTISLVLQFTSTILTLLAFLAILRETSINFHFTLAGHRYVVPGGMATFALLYAIAGTGIAHCVGSPLVALNYERQRSEADYRFTAVRIRENTEQVAMYGGEAFEREALMSHFASISRNWRRLLATSLRLNLFTGSYTQLTSVFPFVVVASHYFDGPLQLGDLMQAATAFTQVQAAMSFCLYAYPQLAEWKSVANRLRDFDYALAAVSAGETATAPPLVPHHDPRYSLDSVTVCSPDGTPLLTNVTLEIRPRDRILITGESGSGKTSLFRTLAGLWPVASGSLIRPEAKQSLFLPQKPYMPIGTLRDALTYPHRANSDPRLLTLLDDLGLSKWRDRLDEVADWGQRMSLGEQQRVAVVRAVLMRPSFLFLDEATSGLDEVCEAKVYRVLQDTLSDTAVVSIGHRATLAALHVVILIVRRQSGDFPHFTLSQRLGKENLW